MPHITKRRIGKPNHKEENNQRRNKKWNKYYGDKRWKRLREWQITNFPLCQDCMIEGRSVPATEVHHRIVFSWFTSEEDRWKALLCPDILMSLCKDCHLKRHKYLQRPDNFEQTEDYKKIHNS